MISAEGVDGTIEFDGRTVTIRREGFRARSTHGGAGSVTVPLEQVTAVEFKGLAYMAGANWHGRLTLVVAGAPPRTDNRHGRRFQDPFSVEFGKRGAVREFEALRDALNAAIAGLRGGGLATAYGGPPGYGPPAAYAPAQQQYAPAAAPAPPSLADQLTRLGEMHRQGLLSAEEFAAAKARLLGG